MAFSLGSSCNTRWKPARSSTKLPRLRSVPHTAECYLAWPHFPHGVMFHGTKGSLCLPSRASLVSADPDVAGDGHPSVQKLRALEELDKQAFSIQSLS